MLNKKAQGMPMNVVIIAIIVLVVLIILIAFFAGGLASITNKIRDLFTGTTSGQSRDIVLLTCQNLCDTAKVLPEGSQKLSGYCKQTFVVDDDSNPTTPLRRMACGSNSKPDTKDLDQKDSEKKITPYSSGSDMGISCSEVSCV